MLAGKGCWFACHLEVEFHLPSSIARSIFYYSRNRRPLQMKIRPSGVSNPWDY